MLLVICPSRGRPEAAVAARASFYATKSLHDTEIMFAVDDDDPTRSQYPIQQQVFQGRGSMNATLGQAVKFALEDPSVEVIGFIGDDHRFRSVGWDGEILDLARKQGPGVFFGDDGSRGSELCTQWFVSRAIVDVFGMSLPALKHLYIDNYWMRLAGGADCLFYMPDVHIEHLHPTLGKGEWDEGYQRVNSQEMYGADGAAFGAWADNDSVADIERLKWILTKG